jgi:hypothetical protein
LIPLCLPYSLFIGCSVIGAELQQFHMYDNSPLTDVFEEIRHGREELFRCFDEWEMSAVLHDDVA